MKNYYVYKLTEKETKEFYFGSRGFAGKVEEDKYLGSPKVWKPKKENIVKEVVSTFSKRNDAILFERELIIENLSDPLNMNFSIPHPNIHREGLISAKNSEGKIITISSDDPLFGVEYFGVTKGMVLVKDSDGNTFYVDAGDPRYLSGELVHNNTGLVTQEEHPHFNKCWINNSEDQRLISKYDKIPEGWNLGTLQKNKTTNSSHTNTCWVHKPDGDSKRVPKSLLDEYLNDEWERGRGNLKPYKENNNRNVVVPDFRGSRWMTDGNKNKRVKKDEIYKFIEKGWKLKQKRNGK